MTEKIGMILELSRSRIFPNPAEIYRPLGVRSFGKGLIEYEDTLGANLSKVTYHRIPPNALVLSNIKAWEGAVAISESRHENFVASQRILPYISKSEKEADVRYVRDYLLSESGIRALGKASPGSADRNRTLGRIAFEDISIPLPNVIEQKAISRRIAKLEKAAHLALADDLRIENSIASIHQSLFRLKFEGRPMRKLVKETSRFETVDPALKYRSAGVKWYAEGVFGREAKPASEIKAKQLNRLVEGEFIYNRLFAWKGSFALTTGEPLHASNEFPTFKIDEALVLPEYLLGWFSLPRVWEEVERLSTGATPTSRNRLKQEQLLGLSVSLPPLQEQQRIVDILRQLKRARELNAERARIAMALPQAARNAEFARLLS